MNDAMAANSTVDCRPTINDSLTGKEKTGDVRTFDGDSYVFIDKARKSEYYQFSNFGMEIQMHGREQGEELDARVYLLRCSLSDGSSFDVPLTRAHLDTFTTLYKKLKDHRLQNATIFKQAGESGEVNNYVGRLINRYEKRKPKDKTEAIIAQHRGFYYSPKVGPVFVIGPNQVVSADETVTDAQIGRLPMVWVGRKTDELHVGNPVPENERAQLLNLLDQYSPSNMPTILALMGYTFMSLHRKDLQDAGLHCPTFHLVGPSSTGKSVTVNHFKCMLPCTLGANGTMVPPTDHNVTEAVLRDMLLDECPPITLDPPPSLTRTVLNALFDNLYQGTVPRNMHDKKNNCSKYVGTGLIVVWQGENANLSILNATSLSKGIIMVHKKDPDFNALTSSTLHAEILSKCSQLSSFFQSFVLSGNMKLITELKLKNERVLSEKFMSKGSIESSDRIIANHALLLACTESVLNHILVESNGQQEYLNRLIDSFTEASFPLLIQALSAIGSKASVLPEESLWKELMIKLSETPVETFFHGVSLTGDSVLLAVSLVKDKNNATVRQAQTLFMKYKTIRPHFTAPNSNVPWAKRNSKNDSICGKSTKLTCYPIPFGECNVELLALIKNRLCALLPKDKEFLIGDRPSEWRRIVNKHVDSNAGTEQEKLVSIFKQLSDSDQKTLLSHGQSMLETKTNSHSLVAPTHSSTLKEADNVEMSDDNSPTEPLVDLSPVKRPEEIHDEFLSEYSADEDQSADNGMSLDMSIRASREQTQSRQTENIFHSQKPDKSRVNGLKDVSDSLSRTRLHLQSYLAILQESSRTEKQNDKSDRQPDGNESMQEQESEPEKESETVKESEPEKESKTVKEAEPEKESEPVMEAETEKESGSVKEAEPEKESETVKKAEPEKESEPVKDSEPEKESETATEAEPEKESVSVKEAEPEKESETVKRAVPKKMSEPVTEAKPEKEAKSVKKSVKKSKCVKKSVEKSLKKSKPEKESKPETEAEPEKESKSVKKYGPEKESEPVKEAEPETESKPVTEAETEKESETQKEAEPVKEAESEKESKPVKEAETEKASKSVTEAKPEKESEPVKESEPDNESEPEKESVTSTFDPFSTEMPTPSKRKQLGKKRTVHGQEQDGETASKRVKKSTESKGKGQRKKCIPLVTGEDPTLKVSVPLKIRKMNDNGGQARKGVRACKVGRAGQ